MRQEPASGKPPVQIFLGTQDEQGRAERVFFYSIERVRDRLIGRRRERAIGVIYRPESERLSHYFHARLPKQFDAIIHIDETRAVEPLERTSIWDEGELPETYPFAV